jgi:hypothetical protein
MRVKLFADNDHLNLQHEINAWIKRHRPRVHRWLFVADGSEFTYVVMVAYKPRK